ncbi:hypothetical protein BAE44_0025111, partial [Dichanthelium oligosanthes]
LEVMCVAGCLLEFHQGGHCKGPAIWGSASASRAPSRAWIPLGSMVFCVLRGRII